MEKSNLTNKLSGAAASPILKWVGGKRQLLEQILPLIPEFKGTYFEPFLGGGAVAFNLAFENAILNDTNEELMNCYKVVREQPDVLLELLERHQALHNKEYYYLVRSLDRAASYKSRSQVERAARFIYLNKTGFNGLYRVNKLGQNNVPFGKYINPKIADRQALLKLSKYLSSPGVKLSCNDFEESVSKAVEGDFIYFDPPYVPLNRTSSFTSYTKESFGIREQERLAELCINLDSRGVKFLLSNSANPLVYQLYENFRIDEVFARRMVNSKASNRGGITETIVRNF